MSYCLRKPRNFIGPKQVLGSVDSTTLRIIMFSFTLLLTGLIRRQACDTDELTAWSQHAKLRENAIKRRCRGRISQSNHINIVVYVDGVIE